MYAIVKTGGKQLRVEPGAEIVVERLPGEAGDKIELDRVLMVRDDSGVKIGTPNVDGASVKAEIVSHGRGPKLVVYKYKRRKKYRRTRGHRQSHSTLRILDIVTG